MGEQGAFRRRHTEKRQPSERGRMAKRVAAVLILCLVFVAGCSAELHWPDDLQLKIGNHESAQEKTQEQE